jgi:dihydroneopterin aldolase
MNQIPKSKPSSKIEICQLTTDVNLGVSDEEKTYLQKVKWDVEIQFPELVTGCLNDNIDNTLCYDRIVNKINDICKMQSYNLIEHLCFKVYTAIKNKTNQASIKVTVAKSPKNNNDLTYKANFTISDF